MDGAVARAADLLQRARHATVFSGAGISVESGIPPFRGPGGLWSRIDSSCPHRRHGWGRRPMRSSRSASAR